MTGERVALPSFIAGSVLAGGNAVAIRFSNRELPPLWGAGLRFALAAGLLLLVMGVMRLPFPKGRGLLGALLYGAIGFGGAFALAYYALKDLRAGLGQTLLALVPLATLLVAVAWRQERLRTSAVVGSMIALAGVGVISGASFEGSIPVHSLVATLGAVLCFAQAAVLVRRFPPLHPVAMNTVAMTTGAVLLILASLVVGEELTLPSRATTWAALGYVVPIGSVLVFILYLLVLEHWSASRAAYEFVLIPFVTVLLSAWLDDERVGWSLVAGGLLVLAGVYVGALSPAADSTEPDRKEGIRDDRAR